MGQLPSKLTDLEFEKIKLYRQYADNVALCNFVVSLNNYIWEFLNSFLTEFKQDLDIHKAEVFSTYSAFYLKNYYGLKEIPDPTSKKTPTIFTWDDGKEKWDSDNPKFVWDAVVVDEGRQGYLTVNTWAMIAKLMLDYSKPQFNLDMLRRLCELYYKSMNEDKDNPTLDFAKIMRVKQIKTDNEFNNERQLVLEIPDTELWQSFYMIVNYAPDLIGLPYGRPLVIQFFSLNSFLSGKTKIICADENTPVESILISNGDTIADVTDYKEGIFETTIDFEKSTPFGDNSKAYTFTTTPLKASNKGTFVVEISNVRTGKKQETTTFEVIVGPALMEIQDTFEGEPDINYTIPFTYFGDKVSFELVEEKPSVDNPTIKYMGVSNEDGNKQVMFKGLKTSRATLTAKSSIESLTDAVKICQITINSQVELDEFNQKVTDIHTEVENTKTSIDDNEINTLIQKINALKESYRYFDHTALDEYITTLNESLFNNEKARFEAELAVLIKEADDAMLINNRTKMQESIAKLDQLSLKYPNQDHTELETKKAQVVKKLS